MQIKSPIRPLWNSGSGVSGRVCVAWAGHLAIFLLVRRTVTATTAMMTTATPANTVNGRFNAPDGDELDEPTVIWTVAEWDRDPLVAVTLTE